MSYRGKLTPGGFPYRPHPHRYAGSNSDRQSIGDPGHCEDCCSVGHLIAHPDYGCGDVMCTRTHGEDCPECPPPLAAHTDRGQCPPVGMALAEARDLERRVQDQAWAWSVVGRDDLRRSIETGVSTVMWDHEGVSWFSWFSQQGRWTR